MITSTQLFRLALAPVLILIDVGTVLGALNGTIPYLGACLILVVAALLGLRVAQW